MKTAIKLTRTQFTKLETEVEHFLFDLERTMGLSLDRVCVCAWMFPKSGNIVVRRNFPKNGVDAFTAVTSCNQRSPVSTVAARLAWDLEDNN